MGIMSGASGTISNIPTFTSWDLGLKREPEIENLFEKIMTEPLAR